jgi:hypothetical protein
LFKHPSDPKKELLRLTTGAIRRSVFFGTADADGATRAGLRNMELDENEAYAWVICAFNFLAITRT